MHLSYVGCWPSAVQNPNRKPSQTFGSTQNRHAYFRIQRHADLARLLDAVGQQILHLLQEDARLPFSEIGRRVGLTAPAVAERVRRMQDAGIITGFHAAVNPARLGLGITAYIHITAHNGRCDPVQTFAMQHSNITECYCIAGDQDLMLKGVFESVEQLQRLVDELTRYGSVSTKLVLSTYLSRRSLR